MQSPQIRFLTVPIFVFLVIIGSSASVLAQQNGLLQGTVSDQSTGKPIVRSNVILMQDGRFAGAVSTNASGVYMVDDVPAGIYDILFAYKGLDADQNTVSDVEIEGGMITTLDVVLGADGIQTDGPVITADTRSNNVVATIELPENQPENQPEQLEVETETQQTATQETYGFFAERGFVLTSDQKQSTFGLDVDQAFYTLIRRMIGNHYTPPAGAVRIEEMLNYFVYDYARYATSDDGKNPVQLHTDLMICPWNSGHLLMRIGVQADEVIPDQLPPSNLVLLADVSGSMDATSKLPLVRASLRMLVDQLRPEDKVSIVQYRESASLVLSPTSAAEKETIFRAIASLKPSGSTAGAAGINLAYKVASDNYLKNGNNRIIVCTDGDFNVGPQTDKEMEELIIELRKTGIYLTVLGFGSGNYKDAKLEILADKGNGQYAYIDNIRAAEKTLVSELGGSLLAVAKDAKMSVKFDDRYIEKWRLIGYENREITKSEFKKKKTDAGDIGAGSQVTALYELIPTSASAGNDRPLARIELRYKQVGGEAQRKIFSEVNNSVIELNGADGDFVFAAAVTEFGLLLRASKFAGDASYEQVHELARLGKGEDLLGYRADFIRLVGDYMELLQNQSQN